MLINVAQRINAFVQVGQNFIILHFTTTSRKKWTILMRRSQRYAYARLQNAKQCSFRLCQLRQGQKVDVYINICIGG